MSEPLIGIGIDILEALKSEGCKVPDNIVKIEICIEPEEVVIIKYTCHAEIKTLRALYQAHQKIFVFESEAAARKWQGPETKLTEIKPLKKGKEMAKYKNIQELADAFKSGELKDWILIVGDGGTYLRWIGKCPFEPGTDEEYDFNNAKHNEARALWFPFDNRCDSLLRQALTAAGIPNDIM